MATYGELSWPQMAERREQVVVLPLGSMEQHGHHLPLLTDTLIMDEIVRRVRPALESTVLFAPTLWPGASDHHRGFPGTISLSQDTYRRVLVDMLSSLVGSGFRRVVLLNAHGGNSGPGRAAVYEAQMQYPDRKDLWLVLATWFEVAAPQIAAYSDLDQPYVTHACELETSMLLELRPELVDLDAAKGAHVDFESAFYRPDSGRSSRVAVYRPFEQISVSGAYGHPERGTAQKGRALFDLAAEQVAALLSEIASWPDMRPR
jgi:creatinine amidohydrolase